MSSKASPNDIEMKELATTSTQENLNLVTETEKKPSSLMYAFMVFFSILIKVLQPLAIQNAKDNGKYRFNESTMVLLVEVAKLIFCSVVFYFQYKSTPFVERESLHNISVSQSLHFLVPAILYAASNTLVYIGMSYISPAFFHVFGNIRILTAGILYRIMMKKKQTDVQWVSMVLIAAGALLSSTDEKESGSDNPILGFVFILTMTVFSSSASIYTEIYFKKNAEMSIFFQNMILYSYGIVVNILIIAIRDSGNKGVFEGLDSAGLIVLLVQSTMGISLSFIFKYLDNIVYVISLVVSMFITAILTTIFTDFSFTVNFLSALLVVTIGIYLFYRPKILERYNISEEQAIF